MRHPQPVDWVRTQAFDAAEAPYLVLDRNLCIQAVNPAYEHATLQPAEALLGRFMFDAFPDNPATPEARSVANLNRSLETVFRLGRGDRMPIQRYDVPSPARDGTFVERVWIPTNSPLRDSDGSVTGVLHHAEDVTALIDLVHVRQSSGAAPAGVTERLATALAHQHQVNAQLSEANDNLRIALESNRQIGMAVGIIMFSHKVSAEAAFDVLRGASQRTHRKIRDIAADVVERGCIAV